MTGPPPALMLVAHGSRDPRAAPAVTRAAARVRAELPEVEVTAAFLDFTPPGPVDALTVLAARGVRRAVVVPFLLTAAYHVRTDLPRAVRRAVERCPALQVTTTPALGPDGELLDACDRRARELGIHPGDRSVRVVLAAAGSSDRNATSSVRDVARRYASKGWRQVVAAYASQAAPTPDDAVRALRARGGEVAIVSYLLAPGRFHDQLLAAGAPTTAPLADTPEVARLVARRYRSSCHP